MVFFIGVSFSGYAQNMNINCAAITINQNTKDFRVLLYPEGTKAEKIALKENAELITPEGLMSSVLSASSLEWYNFNREEPRKVVKQDFDYIKFADPQSFYYKLKFKITFDANGTEYAVIKYHFFDGEKEPMGFAESMKKIKDRWVTTNDAEVTTLMFFLGMVDVSYIEHIFANTTSDNGELNKIMANNTLGATVDLNGVLQDLQEELNNQNEELKLILDPLRLFK